MKKENKAAGADAEVHAVCAGGNRGRKFAVDGILLEAGVGVPGDAHAGAGPRQVSVLAWEWVEDFAEKTGQVIEPGCFAENISIEGLDLDALPTGTLLRVGEALLQVTERGKAEWTDGDYSYHGTAILARRGLFCRVLEGGAVSAGSPVHVESRE